MTTQDWKYSLFEKLYKHKSAHIFKFPVDPIKHGCPDYYSVIRYPMDLSTIRSRMDEDDYTLVDMARDVQLMISNCLLFNPPINQVHQIGLEFLSHFNKIMGRDFSHIHLDWSGYEHMTDHKVKRTVKPPPLYTPDDYPNKRKSDDFDDFSSSRHSHKRRLVPRNSRFDSEDNLSNELMSLAQSLESINQQLAMLEENDDDDPIVEPVKEEIKVDIVNPLPVQPEEPTIPLVQVEEEEPEDYEPEDDEEEEIEDEEEEDDDVVDAVEEQDFTAPKKKKSSGKRKRRPSGPNVPMHERACEYCGTSDTPLWRRGPSGKSSLCNKCGVKWRSGRPMMYPDGTMLSPPSPDTLASYANASEKKKVRQQQKRLEKSMEFPMVPPVAEKQDVNDVSGSTVMSFDPIQAPLSTIPGINDKVKKPRRAYGSAKKIQFAKKRHVANVLAAGTLPTHHLSHIVGLIRSFMPQLQDAAEEIELDIDTMDPKLVRKVFKYITKIVGIQPDPDIQQEIDALMQPASGLAPLVSDSD